MPIEEPTALTPSAEVEEERAALSLITLLLKGESALQDAAGDGTAVTSYLPKNKGETSPEYAVRLRRSRLVNFLSDAINEHVDRVFQHPPQLGEDVPLEIRGDPEGGVEGLAENIDRAGRHLDVFGKDLYRAAKAPGICYILVDKAPPTPGEVSREDSKRAARVPYFVQVNHENLLEASTRKVNGEERLAHFRFEVFSVIKTSRFDPGTLRKRINVYYDGLHASERSFPKDHPLALGADGATASEDIEASDERRFASFEIYDVEADAAGREVAIFAEAGRMKPLTFIPVSPLALNRTSYCHGAPPYYVTALASLTLEYFQKKSELDFDIHCVTTPVLYRSGHRPDDEDPQTVKGPERYFHDPLPGSDMKYVSHDGASIGEARADLKDVEARAKLQSREPLMQRTGTVTATSDAMSFTKANSTLEAELIAVKDCLELSFDYMMQWEGKPPGSGGSVIINKEGLALLPAGDVGDLRDSKGYRDPEIDRRTYLKELKRRGILMEDSDVEAIIKAVDEELPGGAGEDPEERLAAMEERLAAMGEKKPSEMPPREMPQEREEIVS